ncbi:OprD family outer membrane porin [Hymenobacter profundi]|uniref:OprD family porin n=1 Tax=Hymenobacter profundi TaxID=1982110 RepID=A0ABS6WU75_9BACT|nr:OprD family outer membrane porin [Hymenobacter profundi]MBW3127130.1 OprD family porin [Hymenobacter profundi]
MNRLFHFCAAGLLLAPAAAQGQPAPPAPTPPVTGRPDLKPYSLTPVADTARARTLGEAFRRGQWHGRVRNYFMATINRGGLPDYYANGLGAGARFETAPLHGFQLGAGGFFWVNLASSDLATPDPATGALNRYEVGLFDVTEPGRRQLTGRPEELFGRYRFRSSVATFGRQLLSTPLLNPYDGRLTPSYAQGLWLEIGELPRTTITAGWLTHLGPRSTTAWYSVANSIGVYPSGVSETGQRSAYAGNLRSRGLGVLAVSRQLGERTRAQVWNYYADNLFNTVFTEITTSRDAGAGQLTLGGQFLYQRTVGTGGNADPRLAYSVPGREAQALSAPGLSAGCLARERQLHPHHPRRALPVPARMGPRAVLHVYAPRAGRGRRRAGRGRAAGQLRRARRAGPESGSGLRPLLPARCARCPPQQVRHAFLPAAERLAGLPVPGLGDGAEGAAAVRLQGRAGRHLRRSPLRGKQGGPAPAEPDCQLRFLEAPTRPS